MPKNDPADEIAARLVAALGARRAGGRGYPVPLNDLIREAAPDAPPEDLARALKKQAFASAAIVSVKFVHTAPVAHAGPDGVRALAESPLLIEAAFVAAEETVDPPFAIARLAAKVAQPLRQPFADALRRRLDTRSLPVGVGTWKGGLYRRATPPPVLGLANRLVDELTVLRSSGPYPATIRQLGERLSADAVVLRKAIAEPAFADRVLALVPKSVESPVVLAGDSEALVAAPSNLTVLLDAKVDGSTQAFTADELAKKAAKPLQTALMLALATLAIDQLPAGVGCIVIRGKRYYVRSRDIFFARASPGGPP